MFVIKRYPEGIWLNEPEYVLDETGEDVREFETHGQVLEFLAEHGLKFDSVTKAEDEGFYIEELFSMKAVTILFNKLVKETGINTGDIKDIAMTLKLPYHDDALIAYARAILAGYRDYYFQNPSDNWSEMVEYILDSITAGSKE